MDTMLLHRERHFRTPPISNDIKYPGCRSAVCLRVPVTNGEPSMKIVTVVGARPQFIKAAVVSKAFARLGGMTELIVHTGQHYDAGLSAVFFEEMQIPNPSHNLQVGSGLHGYQTGQMLAKVEAVLTTE